MALWKDLRKAGYRVGLAAISFLGSLFISAILVLSNLGMELLLSLIIDEVSIVHQATSLVLDVVLIGSAVVVSTSGALMVAGEAIYTARSFLTRMREHDG